MKAERIDQKQSRENATQIHFSHMPALMELETRYAPPVNDPPLPNDAQTIYEPIAKRGMPATEKHKLSAHDYAALSFANALSSSKRGDPLTENNPLIPCDDAVEDGKKVTEIALKSYGEGDKVPLAKIVTLGIKKLSMEAEFKSPAQKACLQEMSQRLVNMLNRDPELKKYAEREGLKEQDLEAAKNIVQEKKLAGDAPERTESLISLS